MLGAWLLFLGKTVTADVSGGQASGVGVVSTRQPTVAVSTIVSGSSIVETQQIIVVTSNFSAFGQSVVGAQQIAVAVNNANISGQAVVTTQQPSVIVSSGIVGTSVVTAQQPIVVIGNTSAFGASVAQAALLRVLNPTVYATGRSYVQSDSIQIVVPDLSIFGRSVVSSEQQINIESTLASSTALVDSARIVVVAQSMNVVGRSRVYENITVVPDMSFLYGTSTVTTTLPLVVVASSAVGRSQLIGIPAVFAYTGTSIGRGVATYTPQTAIILCQVLITYPMPYQVLEVGLVPRETLIVPAC